MTRGDLRNLVLYWLDDLEGGYFTSTQVNAWLNNALVECQKQLLDCGEYWYGKCVTTTLVANQDSYSLPSDFLKCHRLELLVQGSLDDDPGSQTWQTIDGNTLMEGARINFGTGKPCTVTIFKDCLLLRPPPDTTYTVRMFYAYKVTPMTDDLNVPDVPLQYHEYIALLAARDGFAKDERNPNSAFSEKFYEYKEMMKRDQIQRNRAQPRRVVRRGGDDW
jgi:hypothetical protein